MGLDTSHDCWHGSYSTFNTWRCALAVAAGMGDLMEYWGYGGDKEWPTNERLVPLLNHSDCSGHLEVVDLIPLADRIDELLPELPGYKARDNGEHAFWSPAALAVTFSVGLRRAAALGERVEFH